MKFQVSGVDAKTGEERHLSVEADTESAAAGEARERGVLPFRVELALTICESIGPNQSSRPLSAKELNRRAIIIGASICVPLIIGIGGFLWLSSWWYSLESNSASQSPSDLARSSSQPRIYIGSDHRTKIACYSGTSESALDRAFSMLRANDLDTCHKMVDSGEAMVLEAGTLVTVEDVTFLGKAKVRVRGTVQSVWVFTAWLE